MSGLFIYLLFQSAIFYVVTFQVENGKIINPEKVFFEEQRKPDIQFDCHNSIISPGYIDLQLNGM